MSLTSNPDFFLQIFYKSIQIFSNIFPLQYVLDQGLSCVFCVGEPLPIREAAVWRLFLGDGAPGAVDANHAILSAQARRASAPSSASWRRS